MDYTQAISDAARQSGIDPSIALAVARQESGIQQFWQRGPKKGQLIVSPKGAIGIMQVEPATAPGVDLKDPQRNIRAGVGELRRLHGVYGEWPLALAAYNWGQGHVDDALKGLRAVPAEVTRYVDAVLGPGPLALSSTGKLAAVVGAQAVQHVQRGTEHVETAAREHPGLVAAGLLLGTILVIRMLR